MISPKDFVIVDIDSKNYLVKVGSFKGETILGDIATIASDKVEPLTFLKDDVVANLGQKPKEGTAYGVKIEIFNKYIDTSFGKIALFLKMEKALRKELAKHYNKAYSKLEKLGLLGFTYTLEHEVKSKQGKMAGMYMANKNLDLNDKMVIFANCENDITIEEVILHECGHGIWHRLIQQDKLKSKWVEDYSKFIDVEAIRDKELKKHLSDLKSMALTFTEYKGHIKREANDLDIILIDAIIKFFKDSRRLTVRDLDYVVKHDMDFLKSIWPTRTQELVKIKQNPISEYAMKNVQEYFCECFRLHAIGKQLPKTTRKLMEKTISTSASVKGLK